MGVGEVDVALSSFSLEIENLLFFFDCLWGVVGCGVGCDVDCD